MNSVITKVGPFTQGLSISYLPIGTLKLNPKNARKHSAGQIRQLANSIKYFGFNIPVVVDTDLRIIAGHGRVQAAHQLGMKDVPVIQIEHLSASQVQAFAIADNRLTENSVWDEQLLAENLQELALQELDFSIEATGFTMGEIDLRIESLSQSTKESADTTEELPEALNGPAISKAGDLWLLGPHRVFCGSALEASSYQLLMEERRAVMVFTDPPYNVRVDGHVGGLGAIRHREFAMASGEMSETEFVSFLTRTCSLFARYSIDGSMHFVCMDWRHLWELLEAGRLAYSELKNICVWAKDNGGMGSLYRSQHELICVFKHGRASHRNNVELGKHGRYRTNLWQYAGANSFARHTEEGNLLEMHPTVKPVAMVADALLDCSARGDIVLDAFLGSGTTLMAAERTGRICYGLELDPLYIDTIIRRWQKYSGGSALHLASGRPFSEIEAEVHHGG